VAGGPGVAAEHARALEAELPGCAVRAGCIKGEPAVEAVLDRLGTPALVVPLLMAEGYILELLRRRLGDRPGVAITAPVGTHPGIAALIEEAARRTAQAQGWDPSACRLLLVGHGTPRHQGSARAALDQARAVRERGGFAEVLTAFLEEPPYLGEVLEGLAGRPVVVVGLFVDAGPHGRDDVLEALARAPGPVAYAGPVGAQDGIRAIVRARAGLA
jgi:sirohydrochlorin ferrochelatase